MPVSINIFKKLILKNIKEIAPKKVLDIGCGSGKYGKIIRNICPDSNISGIEICEEYIEKFSLNKIYNSIYNENVLDFFKHKQNLDNYWNLIILGDVIEHIEKSDGIKHS